MARGTQFLDLITRVKALSGRAQSVAVGVDDLPKVKEVINNIYEMLWDDYDWPFLKILSRITLQAGQRYYDFPDDMVLETVDSVNVFWSDLGHPLTRGIGVDEYNSYDPVSDTRGEPALRWDVRRIGTATQFEIWPIPSTNEQVIEFTGRAKHARLVNDDARCWVDDVSVVNFSAAMLEKDEKEQEKFRSFGRDRLAKMKVRTKSGLSTVRLGLEPGDSAKKQIVVRVS
jgi:hypothetical protein